MAWSCQCGAKSEPNAPGVLGFVMLDSCFHCRKEKISPHLLYKSANGNSEVYKASLLAHKYLINKDKP